MTDQKETGGRTDLPQLLLDGQMCFPLYAAARKVVSLYTPVLKPLDLTYTQYIALLAIWEMGEATVGDLGRRLYLDCGTLTPMLKKMEAKGYIVRERCPEDERCVIVSLTAKGEALRKDAESVPRCMAEKSPLSNEEAEMLYKILYKLLHSVHGAA